jgi:hypothetical protein
VWALYDEAALQAEFDRRLSPGGFPVDFWFDISDVDNDDEAWAAAWQLATEDVAEANPPEFPEFDEVAVRAWLTEQPPITKWRGRRKTELSAKRQANTR